MLIFSLGLMLTGVLNIAFAAASTVPPLGVIVSSLASWCVLLLLQPEHSVLLKLV